MVDPVSGILRAAAIRAYSLQTVLAGLRSKLRAVKVVEQAQPDDKPPADPNGQLGLQVDTYA